MGRGGKLFSSCKLLVVKAGGMFFSSFKPLVVKVGSMFFSSFKLSQASEKEPTPAAFVFKLLQAPEKELIQAWLKSSVAVSFTFNSLFAKA